MAGGRAAAVLVCAEGCGGLWVEEQDREAGLSLLSDQMQQVQEKLARPDPSRWSFLEVCSGKPSRRRPQPDLESYLTCPRCRVEMFRYRWNATSPVILDSCFRCHGTWFDGGEIMEMRRFLEAEPLRDEQRRALVRTLRPVKQDLQARRPDLAPPARTGGFWDWLRDLLEPDPDSGWLPDL
jgi:Zn-finger nucleic acid-binding protein